MAPSFETILAGLDHPEGVAWGPDGRVYAGGEGGQVYAGAVGGEPETIAVTGGFMYGIALDADGNVYACDYGNGEVACIRPDGSCSSYSRGTAEQPLRVPNWCAFDDDGNLYVTDSGEWGDDDGLVFRIRPGGLTEVWTAAVPRFPNGCCLTADGAALLVVESRGRSVVRIPIGPDGAAGTPTTVADLTGSQPDGIALAVDGTMFVGCYRPDRIWRIPPGAAPKVFAEDPDGVILNQPANVAFIGDGLDRLAVSSLGGWSLVAADVGVAGLPLRLPRL